MKAFKTKMVLFWLYNVSLAHAKQRPGEEEPQLRATLLWSLVRMLAVLDRAGTYLTFAEAVDAHKAGSDFLQIYSMLASMALERRVCLWRFRPKVHYVAHQVADLLTTRRNPVRFQCFTDEDSAVHFCAWHDRAYVAQRHV